MNGIKYKNNNKIDSIRDKTDDLKYNTTKQNNIT
jgi:hypothetical protein